MEKKAKSVKAKSGESKKKEMKNSKLDKKKIITITIVALVIIIGAIIGVKALKVDSIAPKQNEPEQKEPEKKLQILDVNSKSRPYAIMINNLSVARNYHSGLQEAYLTYELLVEGGITRLLALYKDANVASIGPVRSSRHYYLDYALENDAYYVHFGWSPLAQSDISKYSVNNINGLVYDKYFWRNTKLPVASEHTVFTSTEKLASAPSNFNYRDTTNKDLLLNYSVDELDYLTKEDAIPANNVKVSYSQSNSTTYTYDAENKVYLRSVNGVPHTDYVTKQQYTVKNIIAYAVNYSTLDSSGRQDMKNVGSGTGYYITNGVSIPITWSKDARTSQTIYKDSSGKEIILNDGNTYIQIYPSSQSCNIS